MNIMSDQVNELFAALSEAQGEFRLVTKDAKGNRGSYATLGGFIKETRDVLKKYGLSLSQLSDIQEGKIVIITLLGHKSGQWLKSVYSLDSIDLSPQSKGSAYTYSRRYNLMAILNLTAGEDEDYDDDGQQAQDEFEKVKKEKLDFSINHLVLVQQVTKIYTEDKEYSLKIKNSMDKNKFAKISDFPENHLQTIVTMYDALQKSKIKTTNHGEIFAEEIKREFI